MTKYKLDRRVRRTRKRLQEALIALILEKGYPKVTISDLLERADVGRSTFYLHYADKDELLASCFDNLHEKLEEHAQSVFTRDSSNPDAMSSFLAFPLMLLKYIETEHRLFKALIGLKSGGVRTEFVKTLFLSYFRPILAAVNRSNLHDYEFEAVLQFTVNSLMALVVWWIDADMPCSAEECASLVIRLIGPGLHGTLDIPLNMNFG